MHSFMMSKLIKLKKIFELNQFKCSTHSLFRDAGIIAIGHFVWSILGVIFVFSLVPNASNVLVADGGAEKLACSRPQNIFQASLAGPEPNLAAHITLIREY